MVSCTENPCGADLAASVREHRATSAADAGSRRRSVTAWLLDTNVLSELRRRRPHRKVVAFVAEQPLDLLYVSTGRSPRSVSGSKW